MEHNNWHYVTTKDKIPQRGSLLIETPRGKIAIFRTYDDKYFALEHECPHQGGPLSEGMVCGHKVTCPLHDLTIELSTGKSTVPNEGEVEVFPLKIQDNNIFLNLRSP